jgi:hypothetical protein
VAQGCGAGAWREWGAWISHAGRISYAWKSVATRDSGGRLRFFKIFPILSKKTPTISVTYKNSHKKAFGVLLKQKETPKKERSNEKKKKKKKKLYGRGMEA